MKIRRHKKRSRVDLAPLIDVVFLLLIFFMLTFAVQGQGLDMLLPKESQAATENPEKPVVIAIKQDGSITLNGKPLSSDALLNKLTQALQTRQDKQVVIESSEDARYEVFVNVLDITRQAGVTDYSIVM
ncbi:putative Biopolymer transport protein [Nitrospina gracilis 3/211]|uniref:Putative Biopolymer transport protein n=1 Tax=Nitrospina gracilis (strain 3/211) TaxID=1266370 RepID=M1YUX9_NITG3|nr:MULTISPECIES: biopolymer transporter ExbD [Nitrospina]MCF8722204.1 biopolymer transport protein ExbD [Nitrospina sp. Nb-3]CCQ89400.1 putative Biopolymer transport protein [Nitrospina gracilis 3/211]